MTAKVQLRLGAQPLVPSIANVDEADQPEVLSRHIREVVRRTLDAERDPRRRLEIVNSIIVGLGAQDDDVPGATRQLMSLSRPAAPGDPVHEVERPLTPLSDAALLTNGHGEPGLGHEIRSEMASAAEVDLLCAFVKWHGIRLLEDRLRDLRDRGIHIRVITTTYLGATERQALDRLVRDFGAQVKVHYDANRTRLHAKAWIFRRTTGFDTAYVGSSNLSRAALLDGVEWNVRLSRVATPSLLEKFAATFDTYWNDPSFETYDPRVDRDRLDDALAEASGRRAGDRLTLSLSGLEVRPYPHQSRILEQLEVERLVHGRHRNLVVAATGTGKTVIAALDYRRLSEQSGATPRLLFVAHRKEILTQSLRTYREVLGDASFGELYAGGVRPERWQHVFASVQSLTAYGVANVSPDSFDVLVVDEFHHAEASTYRALMEHLAPAELLGLTATPERGDGLDVRDFFDGRTAAELRLWDALGEDLLTPFHYFGIADGTDLRAIDWRGGAYDTKGLSRVFTGNDVRARIVLAALRDKVADLHQMKAIGFCVSVEHAEYMTRVFEQAGVPSACITGQTSSSDRERAVDDLRAGRRKVIFAVDVFNEGVDVPAINTVLFLRPTESATVFLQQLGRGLRAHPGKAVLTALDFVGHHRKEFRFDRRYRALTGSTRGRLIRDVEQGFPFLPTGCQIILDRSTQAAVLTHLRTQVSSTRRQLVSELKAHPTHHLAQFLVDSGADLADVVRGDRSWTGLRREAGVLSEGSSALEATLLKRVRAFAHVDDPDRVAAYRTWLSADAPSYSAAPPELQAFARMLLFSVWPDGGGFGSYDDALAALREQRAVTYDLASVIDVAIDNAENVTHRLSGDLAPRPLRVHARYTREEAVAALDYVSLEGRKPNSFREGVLFSEAARSDAFFVTLKKSEADYSPTTMYRDYAISPDLFHWESQSGTTVASATGQRYLRHRSLGTHVLLFAREQKATAFGGGAPYVFLGEGAYVDHRGERPIAITWKLERPMPTNLFRAASVVA
ncbi:MAG TPA: DUF3427 domain-containing protein [Intrasporangium sp.]|nr:DUF3427 domain-containing protein [Intrasporangium sp.]